MSENQNKIEFDLKQYMNDFFNKKKKFKKTNSTSVQAKLGSQKIK